MVADLLEGEPAAEAAGAATPIEDVVAYVRTTRGERSQPIVGWDSLTRTERQVANLVAQALANAQVATTLLVHPATVKTHLTRIFGKLGVTNRTELARSQMHHSSRNIP